LLIMLVASMTAERSSSVARCMKTCYIPFCNGQRVCQLATSFQKPSNDKSMSAWYASYIVATWLSVILFYRTVPIVQIQYYEYEMNIWKIKKYRTIGRVLTSNAEA
jgi:hypothetical protein